MKKIIIVIVFVGGLVAGKYMLEPEVNDVNAFDYRNDTEYHYDTENQDNTDYYFGGHCEDELDFMDRFNSSNISLEQRNLLNTKLEELMIEYGITEDELYYDMDITHNIMTDLMEYSESLGIEYYENHHRGHMFR